MVGTDLCGIVLCTGASRPGAAWNRLKYMSEWGLHMRYAHGRCIANDLPRSQGQLRCDHRGSVLSGTVNGGIWPAWKKVDGMPFCNDVCRNRKVYKRMNIC